MLFFSENSQFPLFKQVHILLTTLPFLKTTLIRIKVIFTQRYYQQTHHRLGSQKKWHLTTQFVLTSDRCYFARITKSQSHLFCYFWMLKENSSRLSNKVRKKPRWSTRSHKSHNTLQCRAILWYQSSFNQELWASWTEQPSVIKPNKIISREKEVMLWLTRNRGDTFTYMIGRIHNVIFLKCFAVKVWNWLTGNLALSPG